MYIYTMSMYIYIRRLNLEIVGEDFVLTKVINFKKVNRGGIRTHILQSGSLGSYQLLYTTSHQNPIEITYFNSAAIKFNANPNPTPNPNCWPGCRPWPLTPWQSLPGHRPWPLTPWQSLPGHSNDL